VCQGVLKEINSHAGHSEFRLVHTVDLTAIDNHVLEATYQQYLRQASLQVANDRISNGIGLPIFPHYPFELDALYGAVDGQKFGVKRADREGTPLAQVFRARQGRGGLHATVQPLREQPRQDGGVVVDDRIRDQPRALVTDLDFDVDPGGQLLLAADLGDGRAELVVGLDAVLRAVHVPLQLRVAQVAQRVDAADQLVELEDRPPRAVNRRISLTNCEILDSSTGTILGEPVRVLKSIRQGIVRALRKLKIERREAPLFVVSLPMIVGYRLPKGFDQGDFAGLELIALLERQTNVGRVIMFWANDSFYLSVQQRLASSLSVDLKDVETFYLTDARQQESSPRFWAKIAVSLVALGTFATFAANLKQIAETAGSLYERIFAEPNVELLATEEPEINAIEGERKVIDLECRNLASVPCVLILNPVSLESEDKSRVLNNSKHRLPEMPAGESKRFSIVLLPTGAGDHKIKVTGTEHAGVIHGNVPIAPKEVTVKVWATIDHSPTKVLYKPLPQIAVCVVTVKHGRPPNTEIQYGATLNQADDVKIVEVSWYRFDAVSSGNVSAITWYDDKPEAFKVKQYKLILKGEKTRNEKEWETVLSRITIGVGGNR
jgi:hypothetical protein